MRATVAILTYNRAELLGQTLAAMARLEFPRDQFEILVIDNNSSDRTPEAVARCAGQAPAPRYILEATQGLDHARNRAIAEARGDIIIFADDDILMEPDWIARMLAPFEADPGMTIGAVGGEVVPVFPDGLPSWIDNWHSPLSFRPDAGPLTEQQSPMGANLAIPRRVFVRVGLFNTVLDRQGNNLFAGGDAEMLRRIRAAGLAVWFAPAARVRHQITAGRTSFRYVMRHAFDSARSSVMDHAGQPGAFKFFMSRLLSNALKAVALGLLAVACAVGGRGSRAKQTMVRLWRACGYLYQIPRSCVGLR